MHTKNVPRIVLKAGALLLFSFNIRIEDRPATQAEPKRLACVKSVTASLDVFLDLIAFLTLPAASYGDSSFIDHRTNIRKW